MACLGRERVAHTHGPISCGEDLYRSLTRRWELHLLRVGGVVRHARSLLGLGCVYLLRCESCKVIELPTHTSASCSLSCCNRIRYNSSPRGLGRLPAARIQSTAVSRESVRVHCGVRGLEVHQ